MLTPHSRIAMVQPSTSLHLEHQGKTYALHATQLETWLTKTFSRYKTQPPVNVNQLLSQFGIKSAQDILVFLQSPSGLATQSMLRNVLVEIAMLKDDALFQTQKLLARQRAIAFLMLGLMHDKEQAKIHRQHLFIQEQIDKKLDHESKAAKTHSASPQPVPALEEQLKHYEHAKQNLQSKLSTQETLAEALEAEWLELERMILLFNDECTIYDRFVDAIHAMHADDGLDNILLTQKLEDITRHYHQEAEEITLRLESISLEEEPHMLMRLQENAARSIQLAILLDIQRHLPEDKKIIQKHGKYYLLPKNQTLDELSVEGRDEAHQAYMTLKPHFDATRAMMEQSRHLERERHLAQNVSLSMRSEQLQQNMKQLQHQLDAVQASIMQVRTSIEQARQQDQTSHETPTAKLSLKPTPAAAMSKKQPEQSTYASCLYRLELCKIRNNPAPMPNLSEQSLINLTSMNTTQLQNAAQQQLRPGMPISPLLMQALLRYNNGVVAQQTQARSPIQAPYKPPSPFSMRPDDPFKS